MHSTGLAHVQRAIYRPRHAVAGPRPVRICSVYMHATRTTLFAWFTDTYVPTRGTSIFSYFPFT